MRKLVSAFIVFFSICKALAQNVGIGTPTPSANLHINGTFKLVDGSQGAGMILTSDSAGMASWLPPPETNYPRVNICCQQWMSKNLDVTTYRNGDPIPKVTDVADWTNLTTGAYCYYNNDSTTYSATYGKLYNWYAVNDPRGLAPEGWHIPTEFEWNTLGDCLGGNTVAGGHMKEIGTANWNSPNTGATNYTHFTGLPGGFRSSIDGFLDIHALGFWWSSTNSDPGGAFIYVRYLNASNNDLSVVLFERENGFSVRCIKD